MDTAQWALLISVLSAAIAGCSLGWNVYRDVVLKPRVRVTVQVMSIISASAPPSPEKIMLRATNFGPGKVTLQMIRLQLNSWWRRRLRRTMHGFLIHDYVNPLSSKLPITLEVGEEATYIFPLARDVGFPNKEFTEIGLQDSFGRAHWASRADFKKVRQRWSKDFPVA